MSKVVWIEINEILSSWGSGDGTIRKGHEREDWNELLETKRKQATSWNYPDIVKSIRKYGFRRPLKFLTNWHYLNHSDGRHQHYEGHHRLAAAIELGYKYLPYISYSGNSKFHHDLNDTTKWYKKDIQDLPPLMHPENPIPEVLRNSS